jgi:hypothetical protein
MTYADHLRPGLHAVDIDDDVALLDVEADRYLCLPEAGPAWRAGVPDDPSQAPLLAALRDAGLALPQPRRRSSSSCLAPPRRRALQPGAALTWADMAALAGALLDLGRGYRGRRFAVSLAYARPRPPSPGEPDDPELHRLCAAFDRAVIWLPLSGKCLLRSFLLLRFLQRRGHDALWVFGVRLWPFAAHCWLQVGDVCLDDWPERLAPYTPIHVV